MSFENAPISKGLMVGLALTSLAAGIFDVKHYFHLQFIPHLSKHHQYWRLAVHHIASADSSALLLSEITIYATAIPVERRFGSRKFASFAIVIILISTLFEFIALILFNRLGLLYIPSGPFTLVSAVLYQYYRIVPPVYNFRIFGVTLSNKSSTYLLAVQLALSHLPGSLIASLIGIISGQLYRSDLINLKTYRISSRTVDLGKRFLLPLLGSLRSPRRNNGALPVQQGRDDIMISTATRSTAERSTMDRETGTVVREWVDELTGRAGGVNVRVPSEREIGEVEAMFPDVSREAVVGVLQRSANAEAAVETLLTSQS